MSLTLPALPYAVDALEPHLSARTLLVHHARHHAGYVDKVRSLVRRTPLELASLDEIVLSGAAQKNSALFNAAAQAWNHAFYWRSMRAARGGEAHGALAQRIAAQFGSQKNFRQEFASAAVNQFGSGWAWLVLDQGRLRITTTSNADTPLTRKQVPLLTIDVWEHAYYFDYQHRRPDYIAAFLAHLVDWEFANGNLRSALASDDPLEREPPARGVRLSASS